MYMALFQHRVGVNTVPDEITQLLPLLQDSERRDHAADLICQRFMKQLVSLIRTNLSDRVQQRVDPEDVLQSVWISFFRTDFAVANSNQLFSLLAKIALRKTTDAARRHTAQKRNASEEANGELLDNGRKPSAASPMRIAPGSEVATAPRYEHESLLDEDTTRLMAKGATPEHALTAFETMERMPEELRAILILKMQNYTDSQVATELGCTRRTVSRRLTVIREWMLNELEVQAAHSES